MKQRLIEYTLETLRKQRELKLPLLTDNENELLGIRLAEEIISGDDERIVNIPRRKAVTEKLQQHGMKVFWLQVGGVMEGNLTGGDLTLGSSPVTLGFSAKGIVEYRYLVPHVLPTDDPVELVRNIVEKLSIKMPLTPYRAIELREGTEFEFIGVGKGKLSATAGWNYQQGVFKARAGLSGSVDRENSFSIQLLKLEKDLLQVRVAEGIKRSVHVELGLSSGVDVKKMKPIASTWLQSLDDSTVDVNQFLTEVPGLEDFQGLGALIEQKGLDPILKAIQSYSTFHAGFSSSSTEERKTVTAFTFALNNPAAYEGYSWLMHLDDHVALEMAMEDPVKNGVSVAVSTFSQVAQDAGVDIRTDDKKILLLQALFIERARTYLENRVMHIERKSLVRYTRKCILLGEEKIWWEDTAQQHMNMELIPPELVNSCRYGHMMYANNDLVTRREEVEEFLHFAQLLGCYDGDALPFPEQWKFVIGKGNDSERTVDLYFSDESISQLVHVRRDDFWKAFVKVRTHFNPPEDGQEKLPLNRKVIKEYFTRGRCYELLRGHDWDSADKLTEQEATEYEVTYKAAYNRDIREDAKEYILGKKILEIITRGQGKKDFTWEPLADLRSDSKLFGYLGKNFKYNFFTPIALCVSLCAREEVVVSNISFTSQHINITGSDLHQFVIPADLQFPEKQYMIAVEKGDF